MRPVNPSSLGRTSGLLRRYPGGTENRSIFATVFGSIPNSRAACRWLIPSTWQARRTRAYRSTAFIPQTFRPPPGRKARQRSNFALPRPDYPAASVRDFLSAALRDGFGNQDGSWAQGMAASGGGQAPL